MFLKIQDKIPKNFEFRIDADGYVVLNSKISTRSNAARIMNRMRNFTVKVTLNKEYLQPLSAALYGPNITIVTIFVIEDDGPSLQTTHKQLSHTPTPIPGSLKTLSSTAPSSQTSLTTTSDPSTSYRPTAPPFSTSFATVANVPIYKVVTAQRDRSNDAIYSFLLLMLSALLLCIACRCKRNPREYHLTRQ
jgi:hypothetical protein